MNKKLLSLLLCAAMVFGLFGCTQNPSSDPTVPAPTEPPVSDLYVQAKAPVLDAADLALEITEKRTISIADESYLLESTQKLRYTGMGTDSLQIALTEEMELGNSHDKFDEFYTAGTLYTTIYDEYNFCGPVAEDEYLSRLIPAAVLDETLYADITSAPDGENTLLLFNSPSAPESWAIPETATFHTASGTALVGSDGALLKSTYTIEYTYGGSHVKREITAEPSAEAVTLTAPTADTYTEVEDIHALRLYETAIMYPYAADSITTTLSETIVSQAAAYVYSTQNAVNFCGRSKDLAAKVDYNISIQQSGQTDSYSQTELYRDMIYTVTPQGGEPTESSDLGPSSILDYCQGYLSENLVAVDYIDAISMEEIGNTLYLELDFTEEYADHLCAYACATLFEDENLLTDLATASALTDCSGYMAVDKYTGMPTAVGILYNASHTIDGVEYPLALQADQSFYLASQTAYEEITGELPPEEAPTETPTPLFYKVTGTDGQEMYLLGTIHVGDEATAFLPQEIYDALNASDALAVEADIIAFEEAMATDPQLAAQVVAAYIYTDGTATKDHLNEKAYTDAIKLLKASGNYNAAVEMMKASIWQNSISNFYLRQGYGLQAEKGVDMRLLKIAKDKGIEIREVESGLFQMETFGSYSDELQAFLLEDLLDEDPSQYYMDTVDLYEKWCAGDEAALREVVWDDGADMTPEEQILFAEYTKAMLTDRNDGMLKVAIDYLESGDTVFYAVGLAHLLAGNGLVDTLRDAGYTVELVTFA